MLERRRGRKERGKWGGKETGEQGEGEKVAKV